MLNCEQVTELCSLEMEEPISMGQRLGLGVHLMMCSGCRNYRQHLRTLRQAMQTYAEGRAATQDPARGESGAES
jgi:predicted anti-sigma-YlaC factor YlaD